MATTLLMAQDIGRDVHPFFKPRQNFVADPRSTSELDEPFRKRQRTQSPHDETAKISKWGKESTNDFQGKSLATNLHESLGEKECPADTQGESLSRNLGESLGNAEGTPAHIKQQPSNNGPFQAEPIVETLFRSHQPSEKSDDVHGVGSVQVTPPKKMLKIRPNGKLASPQGPIEHSETQKSEIPDEVGSAPKRASMKKNLKISANGTLDSPDPSEPSSTPKRRGRKKKSEAGTSVKPTCVVVLKYQVTKGFESGIGRQIDEILLGKMHRIPDPKSDKLSEAPKSTHPFFTGELARRSNVDSKSGGGLEARAIESGGCQPQQPVLSKTYLGPRESRITSKPPGAPRHLDGDNFSSLLTFGTDHAKVTRFPGAAEPPWPPFGMVHIRAASTDIENGKDAIEAGRICKKGRKLKDAQIQIAPGESILNNAKRLVDLYNQNNTRTSGLPPPSVRTFRRPRRKVMTGVQLQEAICSRVSCPVSNNLADKVLMEDQFSGSPRSNVSSHKGLRHIIDRLPSSRSAFDNFDYENEEWIQKYSPNCAEHVLQSGREAEILRDWLKALTVSSVGTGGDECRTRDSSVFSRRGGMKIGRKKKKRKTEELDDFVVSSDDERKEMAAIAHNQYGEIENLHDKQSVMRAGVARDGERIANAIIISGPHGCGKTAAVFATAKELDFEIFEVNSGSRRSGKDVLDKVGDMTRNHLVQHRPDLAAADPVDQTADLSQLDEKLQADLTSGRQGTMQSFFKAQGASKKAPPKVEAKKGRPQKKAIQEVLSKPRDQKQSLILLEEVDVLFEEDKLFWTTVLELLSRSKRPVIMTCSDETLVPLDDMALHAILRFTPPPTKLATDYLMLVAASEGHLLSRDAVQSLYEVKRSDLRASLAELNFYCQMGIGDSKGGLEWMLLDKPDYILDDKKSLRVVSEDTYCKGMGWLGGEDTTSQVIENFDQVLQLSAEVWDGWHMDIGATDMVKSVRAPQSGSNSRDELLNVLGGLDHYYEAFSAADVLPGSVARQETWIQIDTSQPVLNDKTRSSYTESPQLVQADAMIDHSGMSDSLAIALRASAAIASNEPRGLSISMQRVNEIIPLSQGLSRQSELTLLKMASIFEPLTDDPSSTYVATRTRSASSFDGSLSTILQDIAPYVRGIVSYDLRLEEQRRQLSKLLAQPGTGNKKARTTRASRAALEGSSKADVRRERWFPKRTDFDAVLSTGGKGWQEVAFAMSLEHLGNENMDSGTSRRSSIASGATADI